MILTTLVNHLWQSTLLAGVAALLAWTLRRQSAGVRYWLWLVASVKFLIPLSLLVEVGRHLAWSGGPAAATPRLQIAIDVISAPSSGSILPDIARAWPALLGAWLCGFLAAVGVWCGQWRKLSAVARQGLPLCECPEIESLRRIERRLGTATKIEIRLCRASLEPGVFGIFRPVLLWPAGISEHLGDPQLEAILAHELQHVRRRDNLAAAIHMFTQALFWFHPLVWWLGARMVEERERACDERVLALGTDRQAYAEGILKVCEFCLASPLASVAGVAGGDLKKRMVNIMTDRKLLKLDFTRKLLLGAAGMGAVTLPIAFGVVNAAPSRAHAQTQNTASQQAEGAKQVRVSADEMNKFVLKKLPPSYPEAAKKAGIQGKVLLNATIGKEGDVENLQIVSGHPQLVTAAIDAVKQWKYRPYLQDGVPVEVKTEITVHFTLAK